MGPDQTKTFSHLTLIAIDAALHAGDLLRQGFGTQFSISHKEGRHNLVTEYDRLSETSIIQFLTQNVPDSCFLAEESGHVGKKAKHLWIIDPLDGTVNFAHQIPMFSVSIGLEVEGKLFCGVVYQPITHELFVAEKGKGAVLNGELIRVSSTRNINDSMISTGFPYNLQENPFHCIDHFVHILKQGIPIRRFGSAAIDLAYTAAGRMDGFFEVGLSPWDCAAGQLLLEEAGGKVTNWDLSHFTYLSKMPIVGSNGLIHEKLCEILNRRVPS